MNSKNITYFFLAFVAILGWNYFLIRRDNKLFDAYEKRATVERMKNPPYSSIKGFCENQAGWNPYCNSK